jgi:zinc protease
LAQRPPATPAPEWKAPVPASATTPAGTRVVVLPQHDLPMVHVLVTIKAGSALDPANRPGLAAATATMLDEGGAGSRTAPEVAQAFADLGAELEDHFDVDQVQLKLTVLSRNLEPAMMLLGDLLARPRFAADDWKRVQSRRLDEIRRHLDDPRHIAEEVFERVLYGDHPYAHPFLGTLASVGAITAADLRAFYAAHYGPRTIGVVLVGDADVDGATQLVTRALGDWKSAAQPPAATPAPKAQPPRVVLVDRPGAPQSQVRVGHLGRDQKTTFASGDFAALSVLETVLGGSFTSRLNQNLREKHGYVYGAFAHFDLRSVAGPFSCMYGVRTDATAAALKETVAELVGIRAPMSKDELEKGRALALQAVVESFSDGNRTVEDVADLLAHGLPLDFWSKLPAATAALDVPSLTKVAEKLFQPDQLTIVVVGDRKAVEPSLRLLPFVKSIELRDAEGRVLK